MKRSISIILSLILLLGMSTTACIASSEPEGFYDVPDDMENSDYLRFYTGRDDLPQAAAVIMQYTGQSEASRSDAPAYACCGTSDGIASWRTMQSRLNTLESYGIPTEFHAYNGLPHGFGLGTGTVAEGWINDAVAFWERNIEK